MHHRQALLGLSPPQPSTPTHWSSGHPGFQVPPARPRALPAFSVLFCGASSSRAPWPSSAQALAAHLPRHPATPRLPHSRDAPAVPPLHSVSHPTPSPIGMENPLSPPGGLWPSWGHTQISRKGKVSPPLVRTPQTPFTGQSPTAAPPDGLLRGGQRLMMTWGVSSVPGVRPGRHALWSHQSLPRTPGSLPPSPQAAMQLQHWENTGARLPQMLPTHSPLLGIL